jgi:molybdenum cofactor synthesis domain-containing protein
MISADEARGFVLHRLTALAPVDLALSEVVGCVSAGFVTAQEPSPSFANSAMDGFALRSSDTASGQARLRVIDSIFAGDPSSVRVGKGEAAHIMTGAPMPDGADSVCMREEATVESDGTHVAIHRAVEVGESVRNAGEDVATGETLVEPGDVIGPALLGLLTSQGIRSVSVHPRPRVGVLSTGNELRDGANPLGPGAIRDSNRPTLLASLRQSDFSPVDLGIVRDTHAAIREAFERGIHECDAVISTGGVSVGDADYVKSVLADLFGDEARSMQVAIKPGRPFAYAYAESTSTPFFGLAGNPISTLVGFELFVRPALRVLAGHRDIERPTFPMVLDCALPRRRDGKLHLVHGVCQIHDDGHLHVERVARRGDRLLNAVAEANCLVFVPDGDGLHPGDSVRAMVLDANRLNGAASHFGRA